MDERDLELQLFDDEAIYIDNVPIYPIPIYRIARIGYTRFNSEVRMVCITEDDIANLLGKESEPIGAFPFLIGNAVSNPQFMELVLFWLSEITRTVVTFDSQRLCFSGDGFAVTNENFAKIQEVIRLRNCLKNINEEEDNPDNETARRLLQRRKEERAKRKRAKLNEEGSDITLGDLVSILASGFHLPIKTIMEYDLFQFNDQFNRLKIMDDYNVNIQALLHGAKRDDVNLTHWITKIKCEEDI